MKIHNSSIIQDQIDGEKDDKGFTLIEILIAIVLVGILSAVAVVGISNLVSKGTASACTASNDAAKAASTGVANAYGARPPDTAQALAPLDDVPAGGGVVLESRKIVLTRDATGTVRGFTATCTHQGCTVSDVQGGHIDCPCHGSRFDPEGRVVMGPAIDDLNPMQNAE